MKLLRGKMIRVTKLDGCGNPVPGPDSVVTTAGFITLGLTANTFEGTPVTQENANGDRCINDVPTPKFQDFTVALTMCGVDPNLFALMTANPLVYGPGVDAPATGFDITSDAPVDKAGFAIEVWSGTPSDACSSSGVVQYGYALLPFVKGGVAGDQSWENGALNFSVNGAKTKDGSQWGVGPYNVELGVGGVSGPLVSSVGTKTHQRIIATLVPPPVEAVNATALGVQATSATQGAPAVLVPANSYAPLNLAQAISWPLVASPTTAWTAGNYVLTRSGVKIRWSGTTWVNFTA